MPFQQLPTEVKQLIIDEAAESDRLYQCYRMEKRDKNRVRPQHPFFPARPAEYATLSALVHRGKAVSALSLTSRELRELSVKYLFETYRLGRNLNPTPMVLSEPASSAVTRFVDLGRVGTDGFETHCTRVIPALPNLRRMVINELKTYTNLHTEQRKRQFEEAVKNISEWEIYSSNLSSLGETARLLSFNPSILRHISINQLISDDKPYFDNETDPTLLQSLSACSGLTTLVLDGTRRRRRMDESREPSTVPFFAAALSTNFLFVNTLTSLSLSRLSQVNFAAPIDASFLSFASLFPNLTHLRLEAEGIISDDSSFAITGSFTFPSLYSLEISLHTFEPTIRLLSTLSLPSIQVLSLIFEGDKITTDNFDPYLLAGPLTQFDQSLKVLDLRSTHPTYRSNLDSLAKITLPHCHVRTNWAEGDFRKEPTLAGTELEMMVAEAKRYGKGIIEEAQRARKEGSLTAAGDLLGSLEEVKARKKWLEM